MTSLLASVTACTSPPIAALPEPDAGADASADARLETGAEAGPTCALLDTSYTFGNDGGLVAYQDESTLTPPRSYQHSRLASGPDAGPPNPSCAPALPACGDDAGIDLADILRDIANADVQAALAVSPPPVYGLDTRPVDGAVFRFSRADGRGFFAGSDCDGGSLCNGAVPAGVSRLEADLKALDMQELADPSCAAFGQNP